MNKDQVKETAVWIALMGNLKPMEIQTVFDRSAEGAFFHNPNEIAAELGLFDFAPVDTQAVQDKALGDAERFVKMGGFIVTRRDERFPYSLPGTDGLPPLLFATGNPEGVTRHGLAVVGTRKASSYGKEVAGKLGREAAQRGIPLVSGAALGIDAAGHQGALAAGGTTVAVMGSGHFHLYPGQHRDLYARIAEQGLVLSQFVPDTPPLPHTFPVRNRIIARLSKAVVIVEGGEKSGSRHTARFAEQDGIPLFAVPGALDKPGSELPNLLISEGHFILHRLESVFEVFERESLDGFSPAKRRAAAQGELPFPQAKKAPKKATPMPKVIDAERPEPSGLAGAVLRCIGAEEVGIDALMELAPEEPNAVNTALLQLELDGWIETLPGKRYVRKGRLR